VWRSAHREHVDSCIERLTRQATELARNRRNLSDQWSISCTACGVDEAQCLICRRLPSCAIKAIAWSGQVNLERHDAKLVGTTLNAGDQLG
jgi:hypothetical protein